MRSATGINEGLAVSVAAFSHWVMRCAVASFHEGRGLTVVTEGVVADVSFSVADLQCDRVNPITSMEASVYVFILVS